MDDEIPGTTSLMVSSNNMLERPIYLHPKMHYEQYTHVCLIVPHHSKCLAMAIQDTGDYAEHFAKCFIWLAYQAKLAHF